MLAWGWRVHQARTLARLQVASLTPCGTSAEGVLGGLAAARIATRASRPDRRTWQLLAIGNRLEVAMVRKGWCSGRTGIPREA